MPLMAQVKDTALCGVGGGVSQLLSGVCWNHLECGTGQPWMGSSRASTENISWVIRAPHGQCQVQEKMPSGARGTFPVPPPPVVGLGTKLGKHCCSLLFPPYCQETLGGALCEINQPQG